MKQDLLVEVGVEELPSSFIEAALGALPALVERRLAALRLGHGGVEVYGTPRRLAAITRQVDGRQAELSEELTGPPLGVAFDREGRPSRAAEAFAAKIGVPVAELRTVETAKGKYVAGTRRAPGLPALELFRAALPELLAEIPFRKSMRWGGGDTTFGRPIHWLVALLGAEVIPFTFAGVESGRRSRGHRFLSPSPIDLASPAEYLSRLSEAHVLAHPGERASVMREKLLLAARGASATLIEDDFLLAENLGLVEEPHVIAGAFDAVYLALPEAVILEVMRGHQRYFGMRGANGRLSPGYLAVVNTAENPEIRKGNDRVMRARLSDARFFDEDCRVPLAVRRERLAGIVFQNRLGHMLAKTERVEHLTAELGRRLGASAGVLATARRAAHLAKCDLVSLMVGEFPDLQGTMGREYALVQGEAQDVADAIRDHYAPRTAKDDLPPGDAAALLAIAERMDTLVGCFAVGLSPTGATDPFALRRAAIGVLRILLARGYEVPLGEMVAAAYEGFAFVSLDLSLGDVAPKLAEFFRERLRGLLAADLPADVVDACLAASDDRPADARARAAALSALDPAVRASAGLVFKRATNIAKGAPPGPPVAPGEVGQAATEGGVPPAEAALFAAFAALEGDLIGASGRADWAAAFAAIAAFAPALHRFFEEVLVMADDERLRDNRLRMMRAISERCAAVAHFQLLSPPSAG